MNGSAANPYLRTKVLTAGPEQLRLMLFDGAVKFCRQGRHCLGRGDYEGMYNALTRAQKIVLELSTSLDRKAAPELIDRIAALYDYIYRRLVDATMERDTAAVDEAASLLEYERETWLLLMKKLREPATGRPGMGGAAAAPSDEEDRGAAPPPRVLASIGPDADPPDRAAGGFSTSG